ncbi:(2Fe-2S)-binding protein [Alloyangia pacifica]|uniref:(2Fe-2S)-binding protein n=1 Tax=Alloyangia pacifica TaxID=311180 RepID=UPI001CD64283|nr:(2Fe-2S)-binding protein [Alloyangia pacifica]MCA0994884.1 (2Fe-2S)-binding protein [Alloyangia pacifica]
MFRRDPLPPEDTIEILLDGEPLAARRGETVALAMLAGGVQHFRGSVVSGAPRAPYCLMGVCFECLVTIDGVANRQACMVTVAPGMRVTRQSGAPAILPGVPSEAPQ